MSDFFGEDFDLSKFLDTLRKSASIKAGAVIFGEAQLTYYTTLKEGMSEEMAYNMLAHTTEHILRGIAAAAGPISEALIQGAVLQDAAKNVAARMEAEMATGVKTETPKPSDEDYEVDAPGVKR